MPLLDASKNTTTKVLHFNLGAGASCLEHDCTIQLEECKTQVPCSSPFRCTGSGWDGVRFLESSPVKCCVLHLCQKLS